MSFPSEQNTAPRDKRYIGLFHYDSYWRSWGKVIDVDDQFWYVQEVNVDGSVRRHCTPMHANRFADKPFEVTREHLK